jgi:hypothetical protein
VEVPIKPADKPKLKKIRFLVREKKAFEKKLLDETMTDLKNQKETLNIIYSYTEKFHHSPSQ